MEGASPDGAVLLGAILLLALSGVPGLFARKGGSGGERLAAVLACAGSVAGLVPVVRILFFGAGLRMELPSPLPGGKILLAADPLSALFLLPVFLVPALGAVYGLGYWSEAEHLRDGRKLRFFMGILAASMAAVLIARSGVAFLVAWEVMALAAFFAATTEDRLPAVREAGWIYLVATHAGTLGLFGMTALLHDTTGSFAWEAPAAGLAVTGSASVVFLLALVGFGAKAGLFPFHFWLPGAHAGAPSHVSAVMSGVMLKVGLYGILRITSLYGAPPAWWGGLLLVLGVASALYGAALAAAQNDLKRLLAYSSIENVGIVSTGIGVALLGRSAARPEWIALGLGGALLHVLFHSLFKPLLFLGAGAVIHGTGTREMDLMGGLLRKMPKTGAAFAVGCAAVAALPPLNGFFSEFLVYLGLLRAFAGPGEALLAGFAAPALALAGGIALAAFVKLFGIVFLGSPRSEKAEHAHEPGLAMRVPILALAAACLLAGLSSPFLCPGLDAATSAWAAKALSPVPALATVAPVATVAAWGAAFLGLLALTAAVAGFLIRRRTVSRGPTWDCGYARPTARMQYTGSSFGDWIAARLTPRVAATLLEERLPEGIFPRGARVSAAAPARDPVLLRFLEPFARRWARRFYDLHALQEGRLTIYLVYVLGTLIALLAWSVLRGWFPPP
ncbi:MAG: hydrogenase [Holophagales bacterium]|nr:hydrogenase [Holophagales bacterium]